MIRLREGLLESWAVVLAGGVPGAVRDSLAALGARTEELADSDPEEWVRARLPLDALVYDACESFGGGGEQGLRAAVDGAWIAVRAVANVALIPAKGGKIVLLAPRTDAGAFAGGARAALENLARTLSVEWARYAITVMMVAPGPGTADEEVAALVSFLISPAGDYFSGCTFELGGVERS